MKRVRDAGDDREPGAVGVQLRQHSLRFRRGGVRRTQPAVRVMLLREPEVSGGFVVEQRLVRLKERKKLVVAGEQEVTEADDAVRDALIVRVRVAKTVIRGKPAGLGRRGR